MTTATLDDVTKKKGKPEPNAEAQVAEELVRRDREQVSRSKMSSPV